MIYYKFSTGFKVDLIITYKFKNEDGVDLTEECIKAKEQAVYRLAAIFQ